MSPFRASTPSPGSSARPSPALLAAGLSVAVAVAALSVGGVAARGSGGLRNWRDPGRRRGPLASGVRVRRGRPRSASRRLSRPSSPSNRRLRPRRRRSPPSDDPDPPVAPVADRTASRFDYDLDHGTPMGPESADVKASY